MRLFTTSDGGMFFATYVTNNNGSTCYNGSAIGGWYFVKLTAAQ